MQKITEFGNLIKKRLQTLGKKRFLSHIPVLNPPHRAPHRLLL